MAGSETKHRSVYRREGGDWLVELRLREVRQHSSEAARTLPESIAHYFNYRAQQTHVELGRLMRLALVNLAIGLVFLAACLALRRSLLTAGSHDLLAEGLLIIGWVALWRPVEMFLYDWWPLLRRQRRLQAIARMPVEIRL